MRYYLTSPLSRFESFFQLIGVLFIFVIVLVLTYVTTRWIAGYQKAQTQHNNLKIVESIRITSNKYIQIIQAGEEFLVIAIGKDEVSLLTRLSKEEVKILDEPIQENINFKEILDKLRSQMTKK